MEFPQWYLTKRRCPRSHPGARTPRQQSNRRTLVRRPREAASAHCRHNPLR